MRVDRVTVRRLAGCLAVAVLLAVLTGAFSSRGWFERLDGVITDLAFPRGGPDPSVAVVAIDMRSLQQVDPAWPWSRDHYARLLERLDAAGAEVVVLDIVMAAETADDGRLVEAMASIPTVVASAPDVASSAPGRPVRAVSSSGPNEAIAGAAAGVGHTQVVADPADGVVRTVPVVVEDEDRRLVPALSLTALAVRDGLDASSPILRRPSGVQVAGRQVVTDDRYRMRVSWPAGLPPTGSSPGPVLSAADVWAGDFDPELVRDRVVFVGVAAPTLGDNVVTPVSKRSPDPGVFVQAAAFHTMASSHFMVGPDTAETVAWVAVLALVTALAVQFLPVPLALAASLALGVGAAVGAVQRAGDGVLLHGVYPILAVALAVPLSGSVRYALETRLRRRVTALFARYVPPPVAAELVRDGRVDEAVGGQRLDVTVLFCDLRGFTPLAASLEPVQVNQVLSSYYEYVSAAVLAERGTIIQYVGDEVFAVFGAPLPRSDHADAALRCALAVQAGRGELEEALAGDRLPMVGFGIGVNTGEVVAVHAGSSFRRQYAVVGDPVNVGARLCAEARDGQVVASEATVSAANATAGGVAYHPTLKGVDRDLTAWRYDPSLTA
jgi:adenylate cyclase